MLESSFFVCPLSCEFVFLVTISIFSAPERSLWGPVDHQVHPCFSLLSVTVHQLSTQPASRDLCSILVCAGPGRRHTQPCVHIHIHTHTLKHAHTNTSVPTHLPLVCPVLLKLISTSSAVPSVLFLTTLAISRALHV